ncbi:MAG: DEAD/DEAH box helicase [Candidatus Pacearchaeota archaeon]
MGLSLWGIDPDLKFYVEQENRIIVPVGVTNRMADILGETEYFDERYSSDKKLDISFTGTLYDYQEEAVRVLSTKTIGVLEAMTGSGKTIMICSLISRIKQPTLILVHTKELKDQFIDKLRKFTTLKEIGTIGDLEYDLKPVTVALLQTMHLLGPDKYEMFNKTFGMVYLDEAHIAPAQTFYSVINRLEAKYKFGGSATPFRSDGLTDVIFFCLGPTVHSVNTQHLKDHVSSFTYEQVLTDYFFPMISTDEYTQMISDLVDDELRNEFIIENTKDTQNSSSVYLSTRVKQLEKLQKLLGTGTILTSDTSKKERQRIISDFLDKKISVLFSTYKLFATGLDIPHLEYLHFCAPIRSETLVRQAAGRLMRKYKGKRPHIKDFTDKRVSLLANQARVRARILKSIQEAIK